MDYRLAGLLQSNPAVVDFSGQRPGAGGKGLVDVILHKWEVAKYLLWTWSSQQAFDPEIIVNMRKVFSSIGSYRDMVGYPSNAKDLSFRATWPKSSEEFFCLVESTLFDTQFDAALKEGLKAADEARDTCQREPFRSSLDRIVAMLQTGVEEAQGAGADNNKIRRTILLMGP